MADETTKGGTDKDWANRNWVERWLRDIFKPENDIDTRRAWLNDLSLDAVESIVSHLVSTQDTAVKERDDARKEQGSTALFEQEKWNSLCHEFGLDCYNIPFLEVRKLAERLEGQVATARKERDDARTALVATAKERDEAREKALKLTVKECLPSGPAPVDTDRCAWCARPYGEHWVRRPEYEEGGSMACHGLKEFFLRPTKVKDPEECPPKEPEKAATPAEPGEVWFSLRANLEPVKPLKEKSSAPSKTGKAKWIRTGMGDNDEKVWSTMELPDGQRVTLSFMPEVFDEILTSHHTRHVKGLSFSSAVVCAAADVLTKVTLELGE